MGFHGRAAAAGVLIVHKLHYMKFLEFLFYRHYEIFLMLFMIFIFSVFPKYITKVTFTFKYNNLPQYIKYLSTTTNSFSLYDPSATQFYLILLLDCVAWKLCKMWDENKQR